MLVFVCSVVVRVACTFKSDLISRLCISVKYRIVLLFPRTHGHCEIGDAIGGFINVDIFLKLGC